MNLSPNEPPPLRGSKNREPPHRQGNNPPPLPSTQNAEVITLKTPPQLPKPEKSGAQAKSNREMLFAGLACAVLLIAFFVMPPSSEQHSAKPESTPAEESGAIQPKQEVGPESDSDFQTESEDGFTGFGDGSGIFESSETFSDPSFGSPKSPVMGAGKGMLEITCPIGPDRVFIDGIDNGKPPMRRRLEPGQYLIKAQKSGYKPFYTWAGIEMGELTEIQLDLTPE